MFLSECGRDAHLGEFDVFAPANAANSCVRLCPNTAFAQADTVVL